MEVLTDKLVKYVAKKNGISEPDAVKHIDKCLMKISAEENTSYNLVYDIFYTFAGLSLCLAKSCSKVTLEECKTLCHCVTFEDKCVPRYIPEAIEINEDPDKWIKGIKINELEKLVKYASYLYHNYDSGGLTDNSFDALEYHLNKRLKTKGRKWEKIGAEPVEKLRTLLPYPMASLDKIKPGMPALLTYLAKTKEYGMVWSGKLDGVSGMVIYKSGEIAGVYTRGNGEIGGNVTYLKDYIKFPQPTHNYFVVRGEFILSKKVWEEKYKGSYANARSFVSAKINTGYISPVLPDIEFVAYQIVDWLEKEPPPPSQAFKILQEQGFTVPEYGVFKKGSDLLAFDVITKYKNQREQSIYNIDGLVLALDIPQPLKQLSNPEYAKAFKMTLEEQLRNSKVTNVDWNITRHGRYFPVAIFESVYVDGVRLHRASAHNAVHVIDWRMGKGTKIIVTRSGDVIPAIKDVTVDEKIKPILPGDDYSWHWSDSGKDILLDDIEGNPQVQIKRITHFFVTIQTPQLGEGRVNRLYDNGMTTLKSIASATPADFKKIKGFGDKLSKTIYENIHNTMRKTRMDRYFVAITTFKTQIGRTLLKHVIRNYPGILTASTKEIVDHLTKHKILGIGPKRKQVLSESIPQFRKILMDLNKADIEYALKYQEERLYKLKNKGYNTKVKGMTFVMTGFLSTPDYDLEDYIWDHWGEMASTVTSKTTAVISANVANITGKMLKANELAVPVYSIQEFVQAFDIPLHVKEQPKTVVSE
uniref:DNA ligase (NAD(+)) n=1 Tax=Marseillevirus LCMAC201 TaxID=2506605 RepID=A0A481YVR6_9VIRU|nr:MAG: NAD-dependent DNA ligase [Marseillevirus LCMAC201]